MQLDGAGGEGGGETAIEVDPLADSGTPALEVAEGVGDAGQDVTQVLDPAAADLQDQEEAFGGLGLQFDGVGDEVDGEKASEAGTPSPRPTSQSPKAQGISKAALAGSRSTKSLGTTGTFGSPSQRMFRSLTSSLGTLRSQRTTGSAKDSLASPSSPGMKQLIQARLFAHLEPAGGDAEDRVDSPMQSPSVYLESPRQGRKMDPEVMERLVRKKEPPKESPLEYPFRPEISKKSQQQAKALRAQHGDKKCWEVLAAPMDPEKAAKRIEAVAFQAQREMEECTFSPKISKMGRKLPAGSSAERLLSPRKKEKLNSEPDDIQPALPRRAFNPNKVAPKQTRQKMNADLANQGPMQKTPMLRGGGLAAPCLVDFSDPVFREVHEMIRSLQL